MDKELLKKILESIIDNKENKKETISDILDKAINEPCEISIKKKKGDKAEAYIEGSGLSLLIALATIESSILKKLNCSQEVFDLIKTFIGHKEVGNNE